MHDFKSLGQFQIVQFRIMEQDCVLEAPFTGHSLDLMHEVFEKAGRGADLCRFQIRRSMKREGQGDAPQIDRASGRTPPVECDPVDESQREEKMPFFIVTLAGLEPRMCKDCLELRSR